MNAIYNIKWRLTGEDVGTVSTELCCDIVDVVRKACALYDVDQNEIDVDFVGNEESVVKLSMSDIEANIKNSLSVKKHVCRFCGEDGEDEFYINSVTGEKTEGCKECETKKMGHFMKMKYPA